MESAIRQIFHPKKRTSPTSEEFWALRDLSFEVSQGEVLGIIGRNGAGKSTVLKILSRITEPTRGRITIEGRVASLLEVGTGFHPELTGRENIYLNGAILGMTRAEIRSKFDEIVAFAEVERFLDTPVKRYSSGMYVRLAFAVAAHLDPEILIVDEVLAVGDTQFQAKCLGKMEDVSRRDGRTVLFVSHNMGVIQSLCPRCILLQSGRIAADGPSPEVVAQYLAPSQQADERGVVRRGGEWRGKVSRITETWLSSMGKRMAGRISCKTPFSIGFVIESTDSIQGTEMSLRISSRSGQAVFTSLFTQSSAGSLAEIPVGRTSYEIEIPALFLMPGSFVASLAIHEPLGRVFDRWEQALVFEIEEEGSAFAIYGHYHEIGLVMPLLGWKKIE